MGHEPPTGEPTLLRAGDTWSWRRSFPSHSPEDGWTIQYVLAGAAGPITISTSQVSGSTVEASKAAADTAAIAAGTYRWACKASKAAEVYTLDRGVVEVLPDLSGETAEKTFAERMLAAIRATLEGRATSDEEEIEIMGRSLRHISFRELQRQEAIWAERVYRERNPGRRHRDIKVRFG